MLTPIEKAEIQAIVSWSFRPLLNTEQLRFVAQVTARVQSEVEQGTYSPYFHYAYDVWRESVGDDLCETGNKWVYELYEEDLKYSVRILFSRSLLTEEDRQHVFTSIGYSEAWFLESSEDYGWFCDKCGTALSRSDIAYSCNYADGQALCSFHLYEILG
jgi:hypothetical protein